MPFKNLIVMDSMSKQPNGSPLVLLFSEFKRDLRRLELPLSQLDEQQVLLLVQNYLVRTFYQGIDAAFDAAPSLRSRFYTKPDKSEQLFPLNEPSDEHTDSKDPD